MVAERLEVRLDKERRKKLTELIELEEASVSEVVRRMIDREYEARIMRERRVAAARELGQMEIEDVPDPEELSRQLAETYDIGDLY